jgi:hypothetical protein
MYEKRICCFIDILGFKEHINQTIDADGKCNEAKTESIKEILLLIQEFTKEQGIARSRQITYFSDSIVISYLYDEESELFLTLLNILHLSMEMVIKGFLIRGGISIGSLYHTKEMVFGPALVEAHTLESKKAFFPRVIVSKQVLEEGLKFPSSNNSIEEEREHISNILSEDDDGEFFVDCIAKSSSEFDDPSIGLLQLINSIKGHLKNFELEEPCVQCKLLWLKRKTNILIEIIKSNLSEYDYSDEIQELYKDLKPM